MSEQPARTLTADLSNQVAIVTGASQGLGREMAIELGNPEARMELVITHPTDLPETKRGDVTYPFVVDRYERYFPVEPRVPQ